MELDPPRVAVEAALRKPRRLPCGRGEALVAVPTATAVSNRCPLPVADQVEALTSKPLNLSPGRHQNHLLLSPRAVLALASPVSAGAGPKVPRNPLAAQIATRGIADQDDVPPTTTVAAVGPPSGNVSLSTEAHTAVAARASFNVDAGAIGKHPANIAE